MESHIKSFESLDKSLRDVIINKNIINLNHQLMVKTIETFLNTITDIHDLNRLNDIIKTAIDELNILYFDINFSTDENTKK